MRRPDRRVLRPSSGGAALLALLAWAASAQAQWGYPGGYGGYGWSRWGADPGAGYMASLGSYARGQGSYALDRAKADSIERESLTKWNRALMAQRRAQQAEQAARDARQRAAAEQERAARDLASGARLNDLLDRILEADPDATRVAAAGAPVTPELIRAIPFETASEPIALCLDGLTEGEAWPFPLSDPQYAAARQAIGQAVDRALREDLRGHASPDALQGITRAVAALHDQFEAGTGETSPGYYDGDLYLRTLAGLSGLLQNPAVEPVLKELESYQGGTVGELISFMHAFNLRFGPAQDPRQTEIYAQLAANLESILAEELGGPAARPPAALPESSQALGAAARDVFKGMTWDDLHAAGPGQSP